MKMSMMPMIAKRTAIRKQQQQGQRPQENEQQHFVAGATVPGRVV